MIIGDFNETLWQFEHFSVSKRGEAQMRAFRDVLQICELVDLGFSGVPYTYDNRREGRSNVKVRLDRALADNSWRDIYSNSQVVHLTSSCSDHCPILLKFAADSRQSNRKKCLHYEICWEREPASTEVISLAWAEAGEKRTLGDINFALGKVMGALQGWSKVKFKNVSRAIEKARKDLATLVSHNADYSEIRRSSDVLNELLYREEMLWLQRSRISWLKEGDRNTRFFHNKAKWRAKKNRISKLRGPDGTVVKSTHEMEKIATDYFKDMFTADPCIDQSRVSRLFQEKVSPEMNVDLCKDFTEQEIADALFQIGPIKAPGPDGFPARFFQRNWDAIKKDVVSAVKSFFETSIMPEGVNDTAIVLIPKVDQPMELKDFRPISLCNVIYKIVSKCLVNRLRPILDELVSQNQSAFVPGRMITDNALLAFECFHFIKRNKNANKAACAYKLDLSKAYDRVDWVFLEQTMCKLGFAPRWIKWIMTCLSSVRYSIKFNGTLLDTFAPSRGLRQGDPLSPFLFLFVADGFSRLMEERVAAGDITPVKICRGAPGISHLLFADDTLLFFKADCEQARLIKGVLNEYALGTGQLVNSNKCSILFDDTSPAETQDAIKNLLQIVCHNFEDKYLGFPTPEGRLNKGKFQSLQEKMWKRIILWGENYLSSGGKEIMLKAVIQAIPVYVMSIFRLPESVCEDLNKLACNFWWGADKGKRKTHWRAWSCLTKPKHNGGLGFRDFRLFNQALLARQAWRLLDKPDSLCARVMKAKYYPNGSLVDTAFGGNASPGWRAIEHGLTLLKKGIVWRIGNGRSVRIWRDPWIPRDHSRRPITTKRNCRVKWVSDLLGQDGSWDVQNVSRVFLPIDAEEILKIRTSVRLEEDFLAWHPDRLGQFSVRSAYKLAISLDYADESSSSSGQNHMGSDLEVQCAPEGEGLLLACCKQLPC